MADIDLDRDILKVFTPEYLSKLSGLDLVARQVVEGYFAGLHRSIYKGFSVEFAEHRPYCSGDDIRYIDWGVYGRRDRYYIKEFVAETSLQAIMVIDASGSMDYKAYGEITKMDYVKQLSSALSYLLIRQRDSVGLALITDRLVKIIPARSTHYHLYNLLVEISKIEAGGKTNLASSLITLGERLTRRGLVILISDLWDDDNRILSGIRAFREKKNECIVFQVLDRLEKTLSASPPHFVREMEGKDRAFITEDIVRSYRERFEERQRTIKNNLLEMNVDYQMLYTDVPHYISLATYLKKRKRLS
ncbi:MAG TPA: DUF58 domain-containing protein [Firmicutes bacterium]|nr:DUF58 domain-containing protein [Bacillota bacterium]